MLWSVIGNSRAVMIVVGLRVSGRVIDVVIVDSGGDGPGGIRRRCPRVRSVGNGVGRRRGRRSVRRGHLCVSLPGLSCASSARVRQPKRDGRDAAGPWTGTTTVCLLAGLAGWRACWLCSKRECRRRPPTDLLESISRNATGPAVAHTDTHTHTASQANVNGRHFLFPPTAYLG